MVTPRRDRGRRARGSDFARGRGARGAGQRPSAPANPADWPPPSADGSESDGWRRSIRGQSISADAGRRGHQSAVLLARPSLPGPAGGRRRRDDREGGGAPEDPCGIPLLRVTAPAA